MCNLIFIYWVWIQFILYFKWLHYYSFIFIFVFVFSFIFSLFFFNTLYNYPCFFFAVLSLFYIDILLHFSFIYFLLYLFISSTLFCFVFILSFFHIFLFLSFRFEVYFFSSRRFRSENVEVLLFACLSFSLSSGPHLRTRAQVKGFLRNLVLKNLPKHVVAKSISNRAAVPSYEAVLNFLLAHRQ
jgi:hypothetical protein